jgi:hypothetical protein
MGNETTEILTDGLRKVLAIRLAKNERRLVEQKATEAGLRPATYIREAALRAIVAPVKSDIPEVNREAWASLARACANLNQYQAAINARQATGYPPRFLEELLDQVQAVRRALIGVRNDE